jgi:hypothetical protein
MTTGRINQVTILKPLRREAEQQVVRFAKLFDSSAQRRHTGQAAQRVCFRDLQSTRRRLAK